MDWNNRTDFYDMRINSIRESVDHLKKKEDVLSYSRLGAFIAGFIGFALAFSHSWMLAVALLIAFLLLFGGLVKYHNRLVHEREMKEYLIEINEMEKIGLQGKFQQFPDGTQYIDRNHRYSYDLDIFGRNSVYQMISRTTSKPGSELLAEWLTSSASTTEISRRQEAISDLRERIEWRQQLMAVGYSYKDAGNSPDDILQWLGIPNVFLPLKHLRPVSFVMSFFTFLSAGAVFMGVPLSVLFLFLIVNFVVNFIHRHKISRLHLQVSKSNNMLLAYSEAISLIETEEFTASALLDLRSCFRGAEPASGLIKKLSKLADSLDTRLNIMVSIFLNLFFFWDIHLCYLLEKWKVRNASKISRWFSAMAEMEVLSSFANLYANNPEWTLPIVKQGNFHLYATDTGHPLIPRGKRVCNNFSIPGPGKIILVSGSNMSGKSTFLRTIGVNMVLAYAGSPVCASSFAVAPVRILTSMRVSDSLEENTSTFYAELKRLAMIIDGARNNPDVFILLDEMLHGTNSNDRHTGSEALLRQLVNYHATAMVATHDLALSDLAGENPENIENYNFDVKIKGEELYFDYRLNRGICRSMNASILMKKMGIEI